MEDAANRRNSVPQTTTMSSVATNAARTNGDLFIILRRIHEEKQLVPRGKSCGAKGGQGAERC